jgi:hypothetical protein
MMWLAIALVGGRAQMSDGSNDELLKMQARVNKSREGFVEAVAQYHAAGGSEAAQLTLTFLEKLIGPEANYNELAREQAEEALAIVRSFSTVQASLATQVALVATSLNMFGLSSTARVAKAHMDDMANRLSAVTEALRSGSRAMLEESQASSVITATRANATRLGYMVADLQDLAARVVNARTTHLRAFREDHLVLDWNDVWQRIKDQVVKAAKDDGWNLLLQAVSALVGHTLPNLPKWYKTVKALRDPKTKFDHNAVDAMQSLLIELRLENKLLETTLEKYSIAFDELMLALR